MRMGEVEQCRAVMATLLFKWAKEKWKLYMARNEGEFETGYRWRQVKGAGCMRNVGHCGRECRTTRYNFR
jgi:hypothetical protein